MTKVDELIKYAKQENADFSMYALSEAGLQQAAIEYYNEHADEIDDWLNSNGYDASWMLKTTSVMIYFSERKEEIKVTEEGNIPDNVVMCFRCGSTQVKVRAEHHYTTEFKCLECEENNRNSQWTQYND